MTAPLTNATDAELGAAVEENLFALFRAMATIPGSEIVETEALSYHSTPPGGGMFKGAWATHLSKAEIDERIERTLAWFKARAAPSIFWWTGTRTQPDDLQARLEAHGFSANIAGSPGMALDLDLIGDSVAMPDGFRIVEATDLKTLEDGREAFTAAFGIVPRVAQSWVDATLAFEPGRAPWRFYVGYLNDQPVATNIVFVGGGVAGLYAVGTIPEARRKGIGAAITLKPLLDARAEGIHYSVLFASEMGTALYEKLGFRYVNITIGRHLWRAEAPH